MLFFRVLLRLNFCLSSILPIRSGCVKTRFVNASLAHDSCVKPAGLVGFTQLPGPVRTRDSCVKPPNSAGFTQLPDAGCADNSCVKPTNPAGFTQLAHPIRVKNNCVNPTNPVGFTQLTGRHKTGNIWFMWYWLEQVKLNTISNFKSSNGLFILSQLFLVIPTSSGQVMRINLGRFAVIKIACTLRSL